MNAITLPPSMGQISSVFAPQVGAGVSGDLSAGVSGGYAVMSYRGKVWTIRHRGAEQQLMRDDGDGPRGSIDVVIVKANPHLSKIWYEGGWVDGSNAPPDCSSANGIMPDAGVPKKQANVCATCPRNQWNTAPNGGKGKACSDSRRLAVVPLPDIPNETYGGPILLRCPAASLQDLAAFAGKLEGLGYPYFSIGVKIAFDPAESFPKFQFTALRPLTDFEAGQVIALQKSDVTARVIAEDEGVTVPPAQIAQQPEQVFTAMPATGPAPAPAAAFVQPAAPAPVAPAPAVQQVAQQAPQPAPVAAAGGFGAAAPAAPAPVTQQVAQTPVQPAPVTPPAAPAPLQPAVVPPAAAPVQHSTPLPMTGFGPATAAPAAAQPSFAGAVQGTAPLPDVQSAFEGSIDDRLNALLNPTPPQPAG